MTFSGPKINSLSYLFLKRDLDSDEHNHQEQKKTINISFYKKQDASGAKTCLFAET